MKSDVLAPVLAAMDSDAAKKLTEKLAALLKLPETPSGICPTPRLRQAQRRAAREHDRRRDAGGAHPGPRCSRRRRSRPRSRRTSRRQRRRRPRACRCSARHAGACRCDAGCRTGPGRGDAAQAAQGRASHGAQARDHHRIRAADQGDGHPGGDSCEARRGHRFNDAASQTGRGDARHDDARTGNDNRRDAGSSGGPDSAGAPAAPTKPATQASAPAAPASGAPTPITPTPAKGG